MILHIDDRKLLTGRETEACSVMWDEQPVREDGEKPQPALTHSVRPGVSVLSVLWILAEGEWRGSAVNSAWDPPDFPALS